MERTYQKIAKLASGGMAEVFLGMQKGDGSFSRTCALKSIRAEHSNDKDFLRMFAKEVAICQQLSHPNIIQVFDYTFLDGNPTLVMEFVRGIDLNSLLSHFSEKGVTIPVPMTAFIISEAARGLDYIHRKHDDKTGQHLNIVHRDISSGNILLSAEGEVKIADFGIAKYSEDRDATAVGTIKGKLSYMSPEQLTGHVVDKRTDIYALGLVLIELLYGRKLYAGKSELDIVKAKAVPFSKDALRPILMDIDDELLDIILSCVASDPNDRIDDAGKLSAQLMTYAQEFWGGFSASALSEFIKKIARTHLENLDAFIKDAVKSKLAEIETEKKVAAQSAMVPQPPVARPRPSNSPASAMPEVAASIASMPDNVKVESMKVDNSGAVPVISIFLNMDQEKSKAQDLRPFYGEGQTLTYEEPATLIRKKLKPQMTVAPKPIPTRTTAPNPRPIGTDFQMRQTKRAPLNLFYTLIFSSILIVSITIALKFIRSRF